MARVVKTETLNNQIDKLSEAIESMMKGFETLQTPRTLDSDIIRVRPGNHMHVGLTGDEDISDPGSFCKDEEFVNDFEKNQVYMVAEDFRAFELRNVENGYGCDIKSGGQIQGILENICKRVYDTCGLDLSSASLDEFVMNLQKFAEKKIECSMVELHGFILKLCEIIQLEQPCNQKISLGDTFLNVAIKERPRKRFQKPDYSVSYSAELEKILQEKDLPEEVKSLCRVKKNMLVHIDLEQLRNIEIDYIREDFEHRLAEAELLKKKFTSQLDSLGHFSKQLRQKDINLLKLREQLESERDDLTREKRVLEQMEEKHAVKIGEIKAKISEICPDISCSIELKPRSSIDTSMSTGRFSPLYGQYRASTPVLSVVPQEKSDELSSLQSELSLLESQPPESVNVLRINRLKTQISTIRSTLAISNSLRNSTNTIGKLNIEHKRNSSNSSLSEYPICASPIPRGCMSPVVLDNSFTSTTKRTAPRLPPNRKAPMAKAKEIPDELEALINQLKLQESRLKERENILEEKENRLQRNWMKLPNSEELVGLVQRELSYMGIIKKEYENKYDELNAEIVNLAKKNAQIKAKERELESKMVEAGKERKGLEEERRTLEQKFEQVLCLLENL